MPKNTWRFLVCGCVLLAGGVCSSGKEDSASAEMLFAQAARLHEVWTAGTLPMVMRADIQVFNGKGSVTPGQYMVHWVSATRWREDLRFSNYERVRVHGEKGYWQRSGLSFQPLIVGQLDAAMDFKTELKVRAKQSLGKAKGRTKDGIQQTCVDVKWKSGTDRTLCFDEANGNLVSVEYPTGTNRNPPAISRVEYNAFRDVGEKRVPFEIRAFRERAVAFTVKVLEMTPSAEEGASLFAVPANSEFWAHCDDMQGAEWEVHVQPVYPADARRNRESGTEIFYAVIEADGTVSQLTVIQQATPALEAAAADAIRQWRYKPASCGATPIRVETSIAVDFHLGP
jgi:TonB family protein